MRSWPAAIGSPIQGDDYTVTIDIKVSVPLIGGKIEGLLATAVKNLFTTEGNHTAEWVATHS